MESAAPPFKLALAQMHLQAGRKQRNIERAIAYIARAAAAGAQVIVLPEAMSLGWMHPAQTDEADAIPAGYSCTRLAAAARAHCIYVCAGIVERAADRVYNSAVLLSPAGEVILHHRKINELEIGHASYGLGDRLGVVTTPLGTFGLMIGADAFAPGQVIGRLGYMGAQVILSPCAWAMPAEHDNTAEPYGQLWRDNYGPVARDFRLFVVGVSNVGWIEAGPWKGRKCIGCSLVVGPAGTPVMQGSYGPDAEELLFAKIEPVARPAQGEGWPALWNAPAALSDAAHSRI